MIGATVAPLGRMLCEGELESKSSAPSDCVTHLDSVPPLACPHFSVDSAVLRVVCEYAARPINNLPRVRRVSKEGLNCHDDVPVLHEMFLARTVLERDPLLHPGSSIRHRVDLLKQGTHVVIR